ncbi:DUF2637 domain-containing protein [Streptomyces sp. A 4/2]|uniref:DUF2637 domain-containing protein n=1 Tax=Streptomyces sp. A 4/2 TaxID=2934314 RepID=UPI0035AB8464
MKLTSRLHRIRRKFSRKRPGTRRPQVTRHAAEQFVLITAGIVIVALTAGAFWLSYAHLADVAGQHGLGGSPIRQWAWPATLDAFIVAGELLMLHAGLRGEGDMSAVALTATGSLGSIALNVAGVNGTGHGRDVPLLDYVVAAVPPTAALLAFSVLMGQIHRLVDRSVSSAEPASVQVPKPPVTVLTQQVERVQPSGLPAEVSAQRPESSTDVAQGRPRGGRPPGAPLEVLVETGRVAVAEQGKLTRAVVRKAVEVKGLTIGSKRLTEVMNILRPEFENAAETHPANA